MNLPSLAESAASLLHDKLLPLFVRTGGPVIVLNAGLAFTDRGPEVTLDIAPHEATLKTDNRRTWRVAFAALGAPSGLASTEARLEFPLQVAEGLKTSLASMNAGAGQPIWLNLLRPYGYLGVAPWERVLGEILERPIYRMPDVSLPLRGSADVLEAAVVFDPPLATSTKVAIWQIQNIADGILRSSSRIQTRINIFATAAWTEKLRAETFDERVRLHDPDRMPAKPEPFTRKSSSSAVSSNAPWLDWISSALAGRAVDAVHFVCEAETTDVGAVLALSHSPRTSSRPQPQVFAGVDDIAALLTRLGASTAMFSPPPASSTSLAMAFVADALARNRPGPVLFHRLAADDDAGRLSAAYSVLFADSRAAAKLANGFIYFAPSGGSTDGPVKSVLEVIAENTSLIAARAPLTERWRAAVTRVLPGVATHELQQAPNWAGAVQRYAESAALDQLRRMSGDVLLSRAEEAQERRPATPDTETAIVSETLADIVTVTARYLHSLKS